MATTRKSTTRTTRSRKKTTPDDSETLRDTQEVAQKNQESLGSSAQPAASVYQSSQFDVGPNPDVTRHMANPPEDLIKAKKASESIFKNRAGDKTGSDKTESPGSDKGSPEDSEGTDSE